MCDKVSGAFIGRHILYDEAGNRLDDQTVLNLYGGLALRLARLDDAAQMIRQSEPYLPYPPRVFISYKRADSEREKLIDNIGSTLRDLGLEVVSDRGANLTEGADVDRFVAEIVRSDFFVPVVTYDYLEGIGASGSSTSYVYDELTMALIGQEKGSLRIVPILVEGGLGGLLGGIGRDNYVDLRDVGEPDYGKLGEHFRYTGPRLTGTEKEAIARKCKDAQKLAAANRTDEALELLSSVTAEFPFVRTAWSKQIELLHLNGRSEEALGPLTEAARNILPHEDRSEFISLAVQINFNAGKRQEAFLLALDLWQDPRSATEEILPFQFVVDTVVISEIPLPGRRQTQKESNAHYVIGTWLDDIGEYLGARNHLLLAWERLKTDEVFVNDLGYVFMNLGCYETARRYYKRALELLPTYRLPELNLVRLLYLQGDIQKCRDACIDLLLRSDFEAEAPKIKQFLNLLKEQEGNQPAPGETYKEKLLRFVPPPWLGCSECAALYPADTDKIKICARCAGLYQATYGSCPICRHDAIVAAGAVEDMLAIETRTLCPICRKGYLKPEENPDLGAGL